LFTKIIAGLIVFILTTLIAYLFRKRQLYVVIPKFYRSSTLAEEGTVSEISIYNRGNKVEEDIVLEIEQDIKCELLAANSSEITLINNKINIPRLHSKDEVSLILLVEEGSLTDEKLLSISSKECKGKVFKKIEEVPPSSSYIAKMLIVIALIISFFTILPTIFNYSENKWVTYNYSEIKKQGWSNITDYLLSDLQESYSNQEFPFRLVKTNIEGNLVRLTYEVINKSALPIDVTIQEDHPSKEKYIWYNYFESKTIKSYSKNTITVEALRNEKSEIFMNFSIKFGEDFIVGILHKINIKPYTLLVDKELEKNMIGLWKLDENMSLYTSVIEYKSNGLYSIKTWTDSARKKLLFILNGNWWIEDNQIFYDEKNATNSIFKEKNKLLDIVKYNFENHSKVINITHSKVLMLNPKNRIKKFIRE